MKRSKHLWVEVKLPRTLTDVLDLIAKRSEETPETVIRVILTMQVMRLQAAGVAAPGKKKRRR